jgi:hypothetical protein
MYPYTCVYTYVSKHKKIKFKKEDNLIKVKKKKTQKNQSTIPRKRGVFSWVAKKCYITVSK